MAPDDPGLIEDVFPVLVELRTELTADRLRAMYDERRARDAGCTVLDLDSGVQRGRAHGFYFREGMAITSFHFAKGL